MTNAIAEMQDSLESTVDKIGVLATVELLRNICFEKAEHIQTNWQDEALAKQWEKLGTQLDKFAAQNARFVKF